MTKTKREKLDLEVAQMRVREAEEKIKVLFGENPTNTFVTDSMKQYPLLPDANIKFVLHGTGNIIQVRIRKEWLEIMGNSPIEILPQASNTIQIRVKPDR